MRAFIITHFDYKTAQRFLSFVTEELEEHIVYLSSDGGTVECAEIMADYVNSQSKLNLTVTVLYQAHSAASWFLMNLKRQKIVLCKCSYFGIHLFSSKLEFRTLNTKDLEYIEEFDKLDYMKKRLLVKLGPELTVPEIRKIESGGLVLLPASRMRRLLKLCTDNVVTIREN